jgi:S1-C subfamily serine protease/photosystem II stability/assembly factor-like uncharacterized protein
MKITRPNPTACFPALCCTAAIALASLGPCLLAQDAPDNKSQRLQEIEKQLRELLKSVEELRAASATVAAPATQPSVALDSKWLQALTWRSIGPANMSGRIVDLAVVESDPSTYWVATASGGLAKTTNNGVTFSHQFDRESTVSIGAIGVAQSDPNIVWVGTGENNPRNSVSYGDGVYKSTDGGKTWKNMGLKKTYQIGRILIHPKNPNLVYVGALGRLWGSNEERGVFKTADGGETWEKILYVDDKTGIIDMRMNPGDPDTLIAAAWERLRDGYDSHPGDPMPDGYDSYDPIKKWAPGSALYKTTDGGKNWRKLTNGLPTVNLGRVGIDYYRKDPNIVFAIVDSEKIGMGTPPRSGASVYSGLVGEDVENGARLSRIVDNGPAAKAGLQTDDIIRSIDDKPIGRYEEFTEVLRERKIGDKLKLKVQRGDRNLEIVLTLERRPEIPGAGGVYLGLAGEDAEDGVKVTSVVNDGPAGRAGLKADDIIRAVGEKTIQTYNQLLEEVRTRNAGDKVKVKVLRDEQTQEIEVTLAERPAGAGGGGRGGRGGGRGGAPPAGPYLGITGEDAEGGIRLTRVLEDGPAAKAGVKTGDLVLAAGETPVPQYQILLELIRVRRVGDKLKLKLQRGDETQQIEVTLAERPQTGGGRGQTRPSGGLLGGQIENVQDEQGTNSFQYGGVYKSTDGGETWNRINSLNPRPMYFSKIRVDPSDDRYLYVLGIQMFRSTNGGKTFRPDGSRGIHADQHALWINPRDGRHLVIGTDGGFYVSYDRSANWDHLNHLALGQFYHVAICPKQPYHVAGGLQDNGSWCGPSAGLDGGGPINEDWMSIGGGDGFVCRIDPNDPDLIYAESQGGAIFRRNVRTGERTAIRPARPDGAPAYRFNWNTPFILSSHNSRIFYSAGNYVFRSLDRGNNLQIISPEITLTKWGSATALAESPRNANVLWAGTDDGALWLTRDGGKTWTSVTSNLWKAAVLPLPKGEGRGEGTGDTVNSTASASSLGARLSGPLWVSTIEPSRFVEGRAYIAFDGHRSDDDEPHVYVTEDFGKTWKSLRGNLPWGSTRCLREDLQNPNLLFAGTEFGAWFSLDRGVYWNKLGTNLPTVAVHEFALHPANGEIVAATHGRSLWVLNVTALRQIKAENLAAKPALYQPDTVVRWRSEPVRGRTNRRFVGQNPASGAQIYYSLPGKAEKIALKIVDIEGKTVRELTPKNDAGLHRLTWDLRSTARPANAAGRGQVPSGGGAAGSSAGRGGGPGAAAGAGGQRGGGGGGGLGRGGAGASSVAPGTYRVVLTVDGQELAQSIRIEPDPIVSDTVMTLEEVELAEKEEKMQRDLNRERQLYGTTVNPDLLD